MRIAFFGASALGLRCCEALVASGERLVGIFTLPETFSISWSHDRVRNVQHADFASIAQACSVPLVHVTAPMKHHEYSSILRSWHPDLLVVAGWYHLIPRSLRALAQFGAVGLHASLLPRYRGGAPLVWAMINGDDEAGVTLFHLAAGVDDGDIIGQCRFAIEFADDISDVLGKASAAAVELVMQFVPAIAQSTAPRLPQSPSGATVMPQRSPDDGELDWCVLSARQAYDWIRAQTRPYPGAFTFVAGQRLTLWRASIVDMALFDPLLSPGTVVTANRHDVSLVVACSDGRGLCIREASTDSVALRQLVERRVIDVGTVLGRMRRTSMCQ